MSSPNSELSDSEDEPVASLVRQKNAPDYPFDPDKQVAVVDLAYLMALPIDPDADGTASFRALILPQGKTLHVPDEPGCYTTLGPWRAQMGLSMVFFQATTKRDPELLLSFVTMGLLNANATGTYVTSLSLPLTNKRNVFEETPKYTKISDVAGFSDIDGSKMPWSQLLKPALKRQAMFLDMEAYNLAQVEAWVKAAPLAARIAKLKKRAITEIHAACADIAKQDKRAAAQRNAHMNAALDQSEANLWALPPSRYDRPLDERVRVLDAAAGVAQAEWLKTPQRADMQTGKAVCKPTALAVRRPAFAAAAPAAAPAPAAATAPAAVPAKAAPAPATVPLEPTVRLDDDSDDERPIELDPSKGKRKRTPTQRLNQAAAEPKPTAAATKQVGSHSNPHLLSSRTQRC